MHINARNFAGAVAYLGADVESALLALVATSPVLNYKVRAALFSHSKPPKLRCISSRMGDGLVLVNHYQPKYVCVMHATDLVTQVLGEESTLMYLKAKFGHYDLKELIEC